jgi:hypothetical protein
MLKFVPSTIKQLVKYQDDVCVILEAQKNNQWIVYFKPHRKVKDWEFDHMLDTVNKKFDMKKYAFSFPPKDKDHFFFYVKPFGD